jgi:hypothetical protein
MNEYVTQEDIDELGLDQELLGTYDEDRTRDNYEADLEYCQELLEAKKWDTMNEYDRDSNRSYPASIIGRQTKCRTFAGVTLELTMEARLVSGYYEGACFDLEASLNVYDRDDDHVCSWEGFDDVYNIDASDVIEDNWQGNIGLTKIHAKGIVKALETLFNELRDEAEDAFRKASEYRLGCIGHGNNGEAFYIDLDAKDKKIA